MKLSEFFKSCEKALFPLNLTCDICGVETFDGNLCGDCLKSLTFNDKFTCPVCGRKTDRNEICVECKYRAPRFAKAVSPLVYDGGAVILVAKFKKGAGYLKEYFADLICKKLTALPAYDCIIYVPMTKKAKRKRGYNQAEELAKAISARTGVGILNGAVIKVKETDEQKSLNRKERESNLSGCFKVKDKQAIAGKNILVVDDVLTTGATANEICTKLLNAGAAKVYFATIASVEYKQNKPAKTI